MNQKYKPNVYLNIMKSSYNKKKYAFFQDGKNISVEWARFSDNMSDDEVNNAVLEHMKSEQFSTADVYEYDSTETDQFEKMDEWCRVMKNNEGKLLYRVHVDNDNIK